MTQPRRALVLVDIQNEYFDGPLEIQHPPRNEALAAVIDALTIAGEHNVPVAAIRHELPEGAPVFAAGSTGAQLHPEVAELVQSDWQQTSKVFASVFADTDLEEWIRAQEVDTITLVGFMTNNCIIGSAVGAESLGLKVEVLSDATGAIDISNAAGSVDAKTLHTALLAVLHSNLAAVTDTAGWRQAVEDKTPVPASNLVESALAGRSQN